MPLLVVLFVVVPIVELFVIIQVGGAIGVLPTIGLLVLDSILGSVLMRSQGRATWRNFQAATASGNVPAREVLDGALVIFGGALLLTPGFVTDLLGLALLLPPTRAIVRRMLVDGVARRMLGPAAIPGAMAFRHASSRRREPGSDRPAGDGNRRSAGEHDEHGRSTGERGRYGRSTGEHDSYGRSTGDVYGRSPDLSDDTVEGTAHDVDPRRLP